MDKGWMMMMMGGRMEGNPIVALSTHIHLATIWAVDGERRKWRQGHEGVGREGKWDIKVKVLPSNRMSPWNLPRILRRAWIVAALAAAADWKFTESDSAFLRERQEEDYFTVTFELSEHFLYLTGDALRCNTDIVTQ